MGQKTGDTEKGRIRLWFEFYKLALGRSDCRIAIRKSGAYRAWTGVGKSTNFEKWWRRHELKFASSVLAMPIDDDFHYDHATLTLALPLKLTEAELIRQCRMLIRKAKAERSIVRKSLRETSDIASCKYFDGGLPWGVVQLAPGTQLREQSAAVSLQLYTRFWHKTSKPRMTPAFLAECKNYLASIGCKIPDGLKQDRGRRTLDTALRNLARYFVRGEAFVRSAAEGNFPKLPKPQEPA